jgi:SAM-dependent methyltransferase
MAPSRGYHRRLATGKATDDSASGPDAMTRQRTIRNRPERFDAAYYRRYYVDPDTRAVTPAAARRNAAFVGGYLRHLEVPVRRILDLGCGMGRMLRALQREFPRARCEGVEYSPYLCERYGWEPGSAVDYANSRPFDLVVCNDVLPSLGDADCRAAIDNITAVKASDLDISKDGAGLAIGFAYRKEVPLFANLGVYIDFAANSSDQ